MKVYAVILEPGPRNWSAFVPDLPGCVAAGETREETEELIREAVSVHIKAMQADGEPVPEPAAVATTVAV